MVDQLERGAQMVMSPMRCLVKYICQTCCQTFAVYLGLKLLHAVCVYSGYSTWMDEDYIGRVCSLAFLWFDFHCHDLP